MRILVTGSSGQLGEALVRTLRKLGYEVVGLDRLNRGYTTHVGSITDRSCVRRSMACVQAVFHAATLHKPHVGTRSRQEFVDVNITGTLTLLEEAVMAGVRSFVFTSTTSVFGDALVPHEESPAVWVTEEVTAVAKNIYGVTKAAAEDLCQLFHRNEGLACIVLRTSLFFPEEDDDPVLREAYGEKNLKANEYLFRRVDIADVVSAQLLAAQHAPAAGFRKYIISATTPFAPADLGNLRVDALRVVRRCVPEYEVEYMRRGWKMHPRIDRVYDNARARHELAWRPKYDFQFVVNCLRQDRDFRSPLARVVGSKGYHAAETTTASCHV